MLAGLRKYQTALLLVAWHALAVIASAYFDFRWFLGNGSPTARSGVSGAVLVIAGADLGLLSLWAALGSCRPVVRWIVIAACVGAWRLVYLPGLLYLLRNWSYIRIADWRSFFLFGEAAIFGLALLTVAGVACALGVVKRRVGTLRRLSPDELQHDAGCRQFQISHLLMLTALLAMVLGFSLNAREFLSRQTSMRWHFADEAPIYSAETVLFSAFCLMTTTLTTAWAALGVGRPWLRLAMAWATASLLGAAWAFGFTSPRHDAFLPSNAAFSSGVAWLQAVLMSFALLIVRFRGYRFGSEEEALRETAVIE